MRTILGSCLLFAAAVGIHTYGWPGGEQPAASEAQLVLGVDDLTKQVDQQRGTVVVEGGVSSASAENELLALIDVKGFVRSKKTSCAKLRLRVRWEGTMPEVEGAVQVEGQVRHRVHRRWCNNRK